MASGDSLVAIDPLSNRPPASNYATVDLRNGFVVLDFDDTSSEAAQFLLVLPSHYGGGQIQAIVSATSSTATSGDAKLRIEATRLIGGVNLDTLSTVDGSVDLTIAAPTSSGQMVITQSSSFDVTSAIAGDLLLIHVERLATDAGDTLVGDLEFVSLEIREA